MASQAELQFIIKAQDQASAAFKSLAGSINNVGEGAAKSVSSISSFTSAITQAAGAAAGIFGSFELARKAIDSFSDFEQGMIRISRASGLAGASLAEFKEQFDALSETTGQATEAQLLGIAEAAARVGVNKKDLVEFTKTILDLGLNAQGAGAQYATAIGQILDITDNGAQNVKQFGDEIAAVSEKTNVATDTLVRQAQALARVTAGVNASKEELIALAAETKNVPGRVTAVTGAIGIVMDALQHDTLNARQGFQELAVATGRPLQQIQAFAASDPLKVFDLIIQRVAQLRASGQSTVPFLQSFNIQAGEANRVIDQLSEKSQAFQENLAVAQHARPGGASERGKTDEATIEAAQTRLSNSVNEVFKSLGEGVGKDIVDIFTNLADGIKVAVKALNELDPATKKFLEWTVLATPAVAGVVGALALIGTVGSAAMATLGGAVALASTPIVALTIAVAASLTALHDLFALAGQVEALHDRGISYLDIAKASVGLFDANDAAAKYGRGSRTAQSSDDAEARIQRNRSVLPTATVPPEHAHEAGGKTAATSAADAATQANVSATNNIASALNKQSELPLLNQLDPLHQVNAELGAYARLLDHIAQLTPEQKGIEGISDEDIARMKEAVKLRQQESDPIGNQIRVAGEALNLQRQNNATAKERVDILDSLNKAQEKDGNFQNRPDQQQAVAQGVRDKDATASNQKLEEQNRSLDITIVKQLAVGDAVRQQIDVEQKINDFLKDNAGASDALVAAYRARLEVTDKIAQTEGLISKYLPQTAALKDYNSQLEAINNSLLTQEQKTQAIQKLNASTLTARDPLGGIVESGQEELAVVSQIGAYRDADVKTIGQINDLKKQGINLDEQAQTALQTLNRDMEDLSKSQTSGFNGFVNSVGTIQDQIGKLTGTFSSSLSSGIVGALSGNRYAFAQAGQELGKAALKSGIDTILAQTFTATGLAGTDPTKVAKVQTDLDQFKKLASAQVAITAGTVYVNGQAATAAAQAAGVNTTNPAAAPTGLAPGTVTTPSYVTDQQAAVNQAAAAQLHISNSAATSFGTGIAPAPANLNRAASLSAPGFGAPQASQTAPTAPTSPYGALEPVGGATPLSGALGAGANVASIGSPFQAPAVTQAAANSNLSTLAQSQINAANAAKATTLASQAATGVTSPIGAAPAITDISGLSTYARKGEPLQSVDGFIFHHTGTGPNAQGQYPSAQGIVQTLNGRTTEGAAPGGLGVQYVMDRDGKIFQTLPPDTRGAHIVPSKTDNLSNSNTEGMEVIAANDKDVTPAQVASARAFSQQFSQTHPGVQYFGHGELSGQNRQPTEGLTIASAVRADQAASQKPTFASDPNAINVPLANRGLLGYAHGSVDAVPQQANTAQAAIDAASKTPGAPLDVNIHSVGGTQIPPPAQSAITTSSINAPAANSNVPGVGNLFGGFGTSGATNTSGIDSQVAGGVSGLAGQAASEIPGLGPLGGLGVSALKPLLTSFLTPLFHDGGLVGGSSIRPSRMMSLASIAMAKRFHDGLGDDEFPAVLQKGERVLTASQDSRATAAMSRMADAVQNQSTPAGSTRPANSNAPGQGARVTMIVNSPNASSFRSSQPQIMAQTHAAISRAGAKHN